MRIIVGLGNPGTTYAATRHNAGFRVLDRLAADRAAPLPARWQSQVAELALPDGRALLVKPQTYMNRSGDAVGELWDAMEEDVPLAHLLIVTDDIHLPLGRLRFRGRGSCGGHNGLASIEQALGTDAYPRLRIGIGSAEAKAQETAPSGDVPEGKLPDGVPSDAAEDRSAAPDPVDHVLGRFHEDEEPVIERAMAEAAVAVTDWIRHGLAFCQNRYNGWRVEDA